MIKATTILFVLTSLLMPYAFTAEPKPQEEQKVEATGGAEDERPMSFVIPARTAAEDPKHCIQCDKFLGRPGSKYCSECVSDMWNSNEQASECPKCGNFRDYDAIKFHRATCTPCYMKSVFDSDSD